MNCRELIAVRLVTFLKFFVISMYKKRLKKPIFVSFCILTLFNYFIIVFANIGNNVTIAASNALKNAIGVSEKPGGGMRIDLFKKKEKKKEANGDDEDEEGNSFSNDGQEDSRMNPDDAMNHALLKLTNIMVREQNFLMDFFGIAKQTVLVVSGNSQSNPELAITSTSNLENGEENLDVDVWQNNLSIPRQAFKDPKAEKRIRCVLFERKGIIIN